MAGRTSITLAEGMTGMMEGVFLNVKNRSKIITAEIEVPAGGGNGTVIAQGGRFGGWSLYVKDGVPAYDYNFLGLQRFSIASAKKLAPGKATLVFDFAYDGGGPAKGGKGTLFVERREGRRGAHRRHAGGHLLRRRDGRRRHRPRHAGGRGDRRRGEVAVHRAHPEADRRGEVGGAPESVLVGPRRRRQGAPPRGAAQVSDRQRLPLVCFLAIVLFKMAVLRDAGVAYLPLGLAAAKALILGKFVLIGEAAHVGSRPGAGRCSSGSCAASCCCLRC